MSVFLVGDHEDYPIALKPYLTICKDLVTLHLEAANGDHWLIFSLNGSGTGFLHPNVNESLGLKLDEDGRIKLETTLFRRYSYG